jgi:cobalt-zinc-cadmium efflux system protein
VIIASTWSLLRDSLRLSLDGVPDNVDIQKVKKEVMQTDGVRDFHHLHIWALSTSQNALTGHLLVPDATSLEELEKIKKVVKHKLEHLNISHATLEIESKVCADTNCQEHHDDKADPAH